LIHLTKWIKFVVNSGVKSGVSCNLNQFRPDLTLELTDN